MPHLTNRAQTLRAATVSGLLILAGGAVAFASLASASSPSSLKIEKNVHVTNQPTKAFRIKPVNKHEAVVVGSSGYAVYTFQGETTRHLICHKTASAKTNCWAFWPPVSPASAGAIAKQSGITGKLGSFRNHGTRQLTLDGQPLYYFTPDLTSHNKRKATGDELKTFGSIWHIVTPHPAVSRGATSPQPTASTTPATTTTSATTTTPTTTTPTTTQPYAY